MGFNNFIKWNMECIEDLHKSTKQYFPEDLYKVTGSAVKSNSCLTGGPGFHSCHPHGGDSYL